jgi:transposase
MAMELSNKKWKVRYGDGKKVRAQTLEAGDRIGLLTGITEAKKRLALPADGAVVGCYEAGRDGFWIQRFLGNSTWPRP